MPRIIKPMTPTAALSAKPRAKPYKLRDGGGLFLLVTPAGTKGWRLEYSRPGTGKRNTLSLGGYPAVSLADARTRREEARKLLAAGIDPGEQRQADKRAAQAETDTVEAITRAWLAKKAAERSQGASNLSRRRFELYVLPAFGKRPIVSVTAPELVGLLGDIAEDAPYLAKRIRRELEAIWRFAIAKGVTKDNPAMGIGDALPVARVRHHPAITDQAALGELLRAMAAYNGSPVTQAALRLAPMLFQRIGELRRMQWADVDLDAAEWRYIVTKTGTPHIVPLPTQAVAIIRDLQPLTGRSHYVLPTLRSARRPMSENTLNVALRTMGYDGDTVTGHGFRATARTLLDEVLGYPPHVIEQQLAHAVKDPLGRAYNRTAHLSERKTMMQAWADFLDNLRTSTTPKPTK